MKRTVITAVAALVFSVGIAQAKCPGRTKVATGPSGKQIVVCLDGKRSTCMRDSQRLGHSKAAAATYCDSRNLK